MQDLPEYVDESTKRTYVVVSVTRSKDASQELRTLILAEIDPQADESTSWKVEACTGHICQVGVEKSTWEGLPVQTQLRLQAFGAGFSHGYDAGWSAGYSEGGAMTPRYY